MLRLLKKELALICVFCLFFVFARAETENTSTGLFIKGDKSISLQKITSSDDEFSIITPRRRPFGLSLVLFGPTIITSLQMDFFVTEEIQLNAGLGLFGVFIGGKYHYILNKTPADQKVKDDYFQDVKELVKRNRAKRKSIYIGMDLIADAVLEFNYGYVNAWFGTGVYVPIGFQWKGPKGFSYSAELAYLGINESDPPQAVPKSLHTIHFGLKVGYYF